MRSVSAPATLGLVASLPEIVWALIPAQRAGNDYLAGPYHLNLLFERVLGVVAAVFLLASGVAVVRGGRTPNAVSATAAALVCATSSLGAAGWRVVTAGGDGANIGGGSSCSAAPSSSPAC